MATIPVYLTDDDGNEIEQTAGSGDFIIIGYVDQDLFANASGELYTTFFDVVQAATPEQKAEVLRGLRLAKGIRGDLRRFELSGSSENAYVKYNHSIFGGRYQSQYTALGAIAGTYLRRGGSSFTKELVEAALVSGPFATFTNSFPSLVLPGDVQLSVSAGGGTVEGYAWTITDGTTTFSPTVASPTVTLTEGTWTASVNVTIDGSVISVAAQSFDVAVFSAASMAPDVLTPALGDVVTFSMSGTQNDDLLESVDWSFASAPTTLSVNTSNSDLSARTTGFPTNVPLIEGVDYEIVTTFSPATSISVRFLTGGEFHAQAVATHTDASQAVAFTAVDVNPTGSFGTLTDNHRMSTATADALYSGDAHMIILGDSLMNYGNPERLMYGLRNNWKPARWAGLQHAGNSLGGGSGTSIVRSSDQSGPAASNNRDGSDNAGNPNLTSTEVAQSRYVPLTLNRGEYSLDLATANNAIRLRVNSTVDPLAAIGRLQEGGDTFLDVNGARSQALLVGVDTGLLLGASSSPGTMESSAAVTLTAGETQIVSAQWNPTGSDNLDVLSFGWFSQTAGAKFGLLDAYTYNPNVSGLSVSYMGDGGWNIANHTGPYAIDETGAVNTGTHANQGEWYDDDSIEQHLRMVAYKDYARTTLRDKIVIMIENQNGTSYGYTNAVRLALNVLRTRWENAANAVDPSGDLWSRIQFVYVTLPELFWAESHKNFAAQARDFIGVGGYDWCELIDLNQQLQEYAPGDGLDYTNPITYTDVYISGSLFREADLANGSEWYIDNDMVHPVAPGSDVIMSEFWSIVEAAATSAASVSGTVTPSATTATDADILTFTIPDLTGDTDRVVIWSDQASNELGRGASLVTTLATSVTRVDARIITGDGADEVLTGPALTITSANTAPSISFDISVGTTNGTEVGDTLDLSCFIISDAEDAVTSLDCEFFYSLDGGAYTSAAAAVNPSSSGVATLGFVPAASGSYDFRAIVTDSGGLTAQADTTASTTITDPVVDPFGTPDYVISGIVGSSTDGTTFTETTDNIGLTNKLIMNVWNDFSDPRVRLFLAAGTDRTAMDTYWTNNPNSVVVFEKSDGTIIYYKVASPQTTGAFNFSSSGFHELQSGAGWFTEAGEPIASIGPNIAHGGTSVEMRVYPTDLVAPTVIASETLTGASGDNYTASTNNTSVTTAAGVGAGALNTVVVSGGTNGIRRSMGTEANATAFASWLNTSVDQIRFTNNDGDVVTYHVAEGTPTASGTFLNLPGTAYSVDGDALQVWGTAARDGFTGAAPMTIEYLSN